MNTLYHNEVVRAAFDRHLSPAAVDRVIRYNFNVDFYGGPGWIILLKKVFPLYPLARHWYRYADHFDEMNHEQLIENWRSCEGRIMGLADDAANPPQKLEPIFRILGRDSHSMTDLFSHSNLPNLLYDYHRENPEAKRKSEASGRELPEYLAEEGPSFSELLDSPEHAAFREFYLPKLFSFQSIPDEGPDSHNERNLDSPDGPGTKDENYPRVFNVALGLAKRDVAGVFDRFFEKLKAENPSKYEALTGALRNIDIGPENMGPCEWRGHCERRARFWSKIFGGWE